MKEKILTGMLLIFFYISKLRKGYPSNLSPPEKLGAPRGVHTLLHSMSVQSGYLCTQIPELCTQSYLHVMFNKCTACLPVCTTAELNRLASEHSFT